MKKYLFSFQDWGQDGNIMILNLPDSQLVIKPIGLGFFKLLLTVYVE